MRLSTDSELATIEEEFFRKGDEITEGEVVEEEVVPAPSTWSRWFGRTRRAATEPGNENS